MGDAPGLPFPERDVDVLTVLPRFSAAGAAKVACQIAGAMTGQGLRVAVATLGPGGGPSRACLSPETRVWPLTRIGGASHGIMPALMALPALVRMIRRTRPTVLLSAGNHANAFTAIAHALAATQGTALVLKLTNAIDRPWQSPPRRWFDRLRNRVLLARASAVLVLGPECKRELLAQTQGDETKVKVVENPYLDAAPLPVDPADRPSGEPIVLAVGRLTPQKNLDLLLEAMALLQARPWRLRLLGEGPARPALESLAARLGIADRVEFLGYAPDPAPHYRAARVLALSSRWEGLPAVAIEALAVGCPVVTTDCAPALSRVVRDSGVGAVTSARPRDLADALATVLDAPSKAPSLDAIAPYTLDRAVRSHLTALAPWRR